MNRYHLLARAMVPILGVTGALVAASTCDTNGDGVVIIAEVQSIINKVLDIKAPIHDLKGDGVVNVGDAQMVVNSALNTGCSAAPLNMTPVPLQTLGVSPFPISAISSPTPRYLPP
jgi:hypothetical protein